MMSPETINSLSREAAKKAAKEKKIPYSYFDVDDTQQVPFPFPFLGDYIPKGWKLVDELFVDASGFGAEDEPALTVRSFLALLKKDVEDGNPYGYAITQAGQFQVYVGRYKKNG
jgi:hypothetical protein